MHRSFVQVGKFLRRFQRTIFQPYHILINNKYTRSININSISININQHEAVMSNEILEILASQP